MYDHLSRPNPRLNIPPGARPPVSPSPASAWTPYAFELAGPSNQNAGPGAYPWIDGQSPLSPSTPRSKLAPPARPRSRAASAYEPESAQMAFPEPQVYRSTSQRSNAPPPRHRASKSDLGPSPPPQRFYRAPSISSSTGEFSPRLTPAESVESLSDELSNLNLASEDGLNLFQAKELPIRDDAWHRLVPPEALQALDKKEIQRQSIIFEIIQSERDYVFDMQLVKDVFIQPLIASNPPILPKERMKGFVKEVFYNMDEILDFHRQMLGALFARQKDQHPLMQSVADIILDTALLFGTAYETYMKHYPLSWARHLSELRRNNDYRDFVEQCRQDPRLRKHDLKEFLFRPVSRLPRLTLLLKGMEHLTDPDHPDMETIPLVISILNDLIRSTQPGIDVAEGKVKFWNLCESLVYVRGEIVDMDLYEESRTLVYEGELARRQRSETDWHGWNDLYVALLDNHLLLTKEERSKNSDTVRRHIVSRPLPLEYLRLGAFDGAPENRKERSEENGGILDSLRFQYRPMYPFTIYHASSKSSRRYTLFAASEALRSKWREHLVNALGIRKVRQESNMWFAPYSLNDGFFRVPGARVQYNSGARWTGKITAAASFVSAGINYVAVGCTSGVYVAANIQGDPLTFTKVLNFSSVTSMVALQEFNKFLVHHESNLYCYSLDILARVSQDQSHRPGLDASFEKVAGDAGNVVFFRAGRLGHRTMVLCVCKSLLSTTLHALEAIHPDVNMTPRRQTGNSASFRAFSGPFSLPKDASNNITPLVKTVAVCGDRSIVVVDPTNMPNANVATVPDWSQSNNSTPMSNLKQRCDNAKSLGLVRCDTSELLVVYDELGCYITKHGTPSRSSGFIRWETKATSFASRNDLILLFSPQFIEIRNINHGRLVQVIEGQDIRLLHTGLKFDDSILVAMKGDKDDREGVSEMIMQLNPTSEINARAGSTTSNERIWDEWDMA
ncbi:hypothetical protein JAAARDRAFT_192767 [Jaapia argillacea MUCL 33604]|uniref:DH domain-containing protein n=1 Tax=Jaapia argillacea MUCL 33604 TaxID=933084 RepID=A0A067PWZ4_9AGAM|nr:hypothetical protein JAAARDRAFT_192767 [Jaapia argillacea MUCL 33604]